MVIAGIDPGSRFTGVAIVRATGGKLALCSARTLNLGKLSMCHRLHMLYEQLHVIVQHADVVCCEDQFVGRNPKTAMHIGAARGVVMAAAGAWKRNVLLINPSKVKAVTGYGNATKDQVRLWVQRYFALDELPAEDTADAITVALAGYQSGARECF